MSQLTNIFRKSIKSKQQRKIAKKNHKSKHYKSEIKNKSGRPEQNTSIKIALQKINELQRVKGKSKPEETHFVPPYDDMGL